MRSFRSKLAPLCLSLALTLLTSSARAQRHHKLPTPAENAAPAPAAAAVPAVADTDAAAANRDEARASFEKGIALFEEEAWDAALVEFLRSRELYPTRAATKDAALCLRKLHRFDEALDLFEALLREFPSLPTEDRSLAEHELHELATLVGALDIRAAEAGASIVIDGRERGTTPAAALRVNAGTHLVRLSREGFVALERQVQVPGGQTVTLQATLAALTRGGRLKVSEQSGGSVDVVVDNVVVGKTPWEGTLTVGEHSVLLRGAGNLGSQPAVAPVRLNQLTQLTLTLEGLAAKLRIEPVPASASVALDGVALGRGVWEGRVRVGPHRVELGAEGFLPSIRELSVGDEKREVLRVELERDPSSAAFRAANPPRFVFEVGGAFAVSPSLGGDVLAGCKTPCKKTLGLGGLVAGHAGYQLSSGLMFGVDAGYVVLRARSENRSVAPTPRGLEPAAGVATDSLALSGVLLGASAGLSRGQAWRFRLRLGGGVLLGVLRDERLGGATTAERELNGTTVPALPIAFDATESPAARYVYLAPEVRMGLKVASRFELSAGVAALVLIGLSEPAWADSNPPSYPNVGQIEFNSGGAHQSIAGKTIVLVSPGLSLRAEL